MDAFPPSSTTTFPGSRTGFLFSPGCTVVPGVPVPEVLPEPPVTPVLPAPVLPEATVFPVPPVFSTDEAFPATKPLPAAAVFPAAKPFPALPAPAELSAPAFLLAAALSPVMIGSPTLSASLSLSPENLFSAFRSSGIFSQPSAVSSEVVPFTATADEAVPSEALSFKASSDELPSPGMVSDQISSSWMVSGVLLRFQRTATKITTRTTAARSNTGRAGIFHSAPFRKPSSRWLPFRKSERPSREPFSRKPFSREPSSRVPGLRPVSRPSAAVFLLFRSFIYRASPRKRFAAINSTSLRSAAIYNQLRPTSPLRSASPRSSSFHFTS